MRQGMPAVEEETARKAVHELQAYWKRVDSAKEENLFGDRDENIFLTLRVRNKMKENTALLKVDLPHPKKENVKACFIGEGKDMKSVKKVITVAELVSDYRQYKQKRELCKAFDLFFCLDKDHAEVKRAFGKSFFRRSKYPVVLDSRDEESTDCKIEKHLKASFMRIPSGKTMSCRIGGISQSEGDLVENICEAVPKVVRMIDGEWENIEWIGLTFPNIPTLLLFGNRQ
ncbi:MAG: ribosomal protein L1p/L10e family protein [Amphiamblys sp. WSBS2006]|nr:MAG: ribosomal protein L1p/L10e family protein [Amphiamblys sp. WSBS2006]